MMIRPPRTPALHWLTFALLSMPAAAHAVGLGQLQVQSGLGQPLQATVALLGDDGVVSSNCVRARVESSDGSFITKPQVRLIRENHSAAIVIFSQQSMFEPTMSISLAIDCGMLVHRNYQVLLDPPVLTASPAEPLKVDQALAGMRPAVPREAQAVAKAVSARQPKTTRNDAGRDPTETESAPRSPVPSSAKPARSVLKLSAEEPQPMHALKISSILSEPAAPSSPDQKEELRLAQLRFAAALQDQDPLHTADVQARSARERTQILQAEIEVLRDQSQLNKAALAELQKTSYSLPWVAGLGILLLASLGSIAWLAWRLRVTYKISQRKWWEALTTIGGHYEDTEDTRDSILLHTTIQPTDLASWGNATGPAQGGIDSFPDTRGEGRRNEPTGSGYPFYNFGLEKSIEARPSRIEQADMIRLEEISDVLQEVEFWMLLNDLPRVIDILEPLSKVEEPDSPAPWLYLLDAYGATGEEAKYSMLRERFERRFNIRIAQWEERDAEEASRGLDDLPHLVEHICDQWGRPGLVQFLESLLIDNRDGARAGFDLPVYRDLMMLVGLAKDAELSEPPPHSSFVAA